MKIQLAILASSLVALGFASQQAQAPDIDGFLEKG